MKQFESSIVSDACIDKPRGTLGGYFEPWGRGRQWVRNLEGTCESFMSQRRKRSMQGCWFNG